MAFKGSLSLLFTKKASGGTVYQRTASAACTTTTTAVRSAQFVRTATAASIEDLSSLIAIGIF